MCFFANHHAIISRFSAVPPAEPPASCRAKVPLHFSVQLEQISLYCPKQGFLIYLCFKTRRFNPCCLFSALENPGSVRPRSSFRRGRGRCRSRKCLETKMVNVPNPAELVHFPPLFPGDVPVPAAKANLWNSLFKDPKKVRPDKVLRYFKPSLASPDDDPFVIAPVEAVNREIKRWENSLVAYVIGKRPHYPALKAALEAQWKLNNSFQMNTLGGEFFLFSFINGEDREKVFLGGPWNFFGRPIVFKRWNQDLKLLKEEFNSLPIWIRLPKLELSLWDNEILGRIASMVGHPRFIDEPTADRERLEYARICVEISPQCSFPSRVKILVGRRWIIQTIMYEWFPLVCPVCDAFDHEISKCPKKSMNPPVVQHFQEVQNKQADTRENQGWSEVQRRDNARKTIISNLPANSNLSRKLWREKPNSNEFCNSSANPFELIRQEVNEEEREHENNIVPRQIEDNESDVIKEIGKESQSEIDNINCCDAVIGSTALEINKTVNRNRVQDDEDRSVEGDVHVSGLEFPSVNEAEELNGLSEGNVGLDPKFIAPCNLVDGHGSLVSQVKNWESDIGINKVEVSLLIDREKSFLDGPEQGRELEEVPPGFDNEIDEKSDDNSIETAVHITEETSDSDEEILGFASSRARMIREKLSIRIMGTGNADKAFADFCKNRQMEIETNRKKSVVPDVSKKLRNQMAKRGVSYKMESGRKKKS